MTTETTTTTQPQSTVEETASDAKTFLMGNLIYAAKKRFVQLTVPWSQLSEQEQSRTLGYLAEDVRVAVIGAIKAISTNQRLAFRAEVESVQFKGASDIKAALKLISGPESHALADAAGGFITVVIESIDDLLAISPDDVKGDDDQKPLFDASTAGTALDTERGPA